MADPIPTCVTCGKPLRKVVTTELVEVTTVKWVHPDDKVHATKGGYHMAFPGWRVKAGKAS